MPDTLVLTLNDGVRIAVPDSLFLITPYVLREQGDFFEDELPFVRQLLQPGQNVIDIGANVGVYTLPMAQKVGPGGQVWAFEPAPSTAQFLARGIEENGFTQVRLEQKAVSSAPGSAQLAFHAQAELRSIVHGAAEGQGGEGVSLVTLDDCMDRFRWREIELIKIDAEGEESNIIKGGRRFFGTLAPLVLYELQSGKGLNLELVRDFAAIGYDSYRLVPGLNLLVPLNGEATPDPFLLNLFSCKAECARRLVTRGLLLRSADVADVGESSDAGVKDLSVQYHWRQTLACLPYGRLLAPAWDTTEKAEKDGGPNHQALSLYARSRDATLPMAQRFRALEESFLQLRALCEREPIRLRLASLARVANDYGERTVAVNALDQLLDSIRQTGTVDRSEPFLAPLGRFDSIDPGEAMGNWVLAAVLEQLELRERFSSFYAGPTALERLEVIHNLGFGSPEMERRLELVRQCIAQATAAKKAEGAASATAAAAAGPTLNAVAAAADPTPAASAGELINEGLRLAQQSGVKAAQPYFERAAQLEPKSHVPWFMLGNVASELGDLDVAVAHYAHARDLHPGDHVIRYNLGLNQLWRGYIDAAIEDLRAACGLNPSYLQAQSSHLMALHSSDRITPEEIDVATREWGARFSVEHPASGTPDPGTHRPERLRVGFISGDFRTHSVAHFFEPILSARDRGAFAYVLYSNSHVRDAVTERLRASADEWRDVQALSDDALIERIRQDRIDVLVDLSGHTAGNRLAVFARRAAPVQITYLGYPSSTGLPTLDYRITDAVTDPPVAADAWHCERLLRLPDAQWCFRPFGTPAAPGPLPARAAGFVTFGSFNNLTKASDTLLRCWARILVKLPTSRLRLTRIRSAQRAGEILAFFAQAGVAPGRVECVAYASNPPYGQQFAGVDIALDNYPYNGVTTTCESLYVGVPVVSLHGRNGVSRSGLSLLGTLGLGDLAASTPEQYVDIAVALGSDLPRLEQLRASLRPRFEQSSLRDEKRFAVNFEGLLRTAWHGRVNRPG